MDYRILSGFLTTLACLVLSGCFVSAVPLINDGQAERPLAGDILVCPDPDDACIRLTPDGAGYLGTKLDEQERVPLTVHFTRLDTTATDKVHVMQVRIEEDDDAPAWIYLLARPFPDGSETGADLQLAWLDCADQPDSALRALEYSGGRIDRGLAMTCEVTSIEQLAAMILSEHAMDITDDAWWAEKAEDR